MGYHHLITGYSEVREELERYLKEEIAESQWNDYVTVYPKAVESYIDRTASGDEGAVSRRDEIGTSSKRPAAAHQAPKSVRGWTIRDGKHWARYWPPAQAGMVMSSGFEKTTSAPDSSSRAGSSRG